MVEHSSPFLPMLTIALLLHGILLAWWEFPNAEPAPVPERPIIQMVTLAEPQAPIPEPAVQPPSPPMLEPSPPPKPQQQPEPKPLPPPELAPQPSPMPPEPTQMPPEPRPQPTPEPVVAEIVPLPQPAPEVLMGYEAQLAAWLDRHKNYPLAAQRRRQEGEVLLRIRINRSGQVLSFQTQEISHHRILDEAALSMVKRAEPFPPFPDDFPGSDFEFLVPVNFQLR
jgi:periplasmic protein TonB